MAYQSCHWLDVYFKGEIVRWLCNNLIFMDVEKKQRESENSSWILPQPKKERKKRANDYLSSFWKMNIGIFFHYFLIFHLLLLLIVIIRRINL